MYEDTTPTITPPNNYTSGMRIDLKYLYVRAKCKVFVVLLKYLRTTQTCILSAISGEKKSYEIKYSITLITIL